MLLELARPGTLYFALHGDRQSNIYLNSAVQEGLDDAAFLESRTRLAHAPAALQSTSAAARAILRLQPNDNMRAHHLVPVNMNLRLATLASEAGWRTDSLENLIALPADEKTQEHLAITTGVELPIQKSSHDDYDIQTQAQISLHELDVEGPLTPLKALDILRAVERETLKQIVLGIWLPRLH